MPSRTKILIVEDEEILADNLRAYFLKRTAEVKVVPSGEMALGCADDFGPDLLMLDYGLPGMDGLATFARLKVLQPRYGCVLMTGHPIDTICKAARETGIRHILEKPFPFSALEGIVPVEPIILPLQGEGKRDDIAPTRRIGERRCVPGTTLTSQMDGWIPHERRKSERRIAPDGRL